MPQLAELFRAKYPGAYDDMDDAALEAAIQAKYPGAYDDLIDTPKPMASHDPTGGPEERSTLQKVQPHMAAIGGTIGGLAGKATPAGVVLSGLGGAAGQGVSEVIDAVRDPIRPVSSGMDAVKQLNAPLVRMATEGAKQAGLEGIGRGVSGALAGGARRLYQGLAKPSQAIRREFPTAVPDALSDRVPLTRGGSDKASRLVDKSQHAADDVIDQAAPTATAVSPLEVIHGGPTVGRPQGFNRVAGELRKREQIGQPSQMNTVAERSARLMAEHPQGIPLKLAQELKKTAQTSAQGAYRARDRGIATELSPDALLDEATAKGLRRAVEARAPGVIPHNQLTQRRIGVDRMVGDAVGRDGNTLLVNGMRTALAVGGGAGIGSLSDNSNAGAGAGLLLQLLSTPSTGSRAAILANEAAKVPYSHLLRLLMASHQPNEE